MNETLYDGTSQAYLRSVAQRRYDYLCCRIRELPIEIGRLRDELDAAIRERHQLENVFDPPLTETTRPLSISKDST